MNGQKGRMEGRVGAGGGCVIKELLMVSSFFSALSSGVFLRHRYSPTSKK